METVAEEKVPQELREALTLARSKGEPYLFTSPEFGVSVICLRPTRPIYRKFREERGDPVKRAGAFESLFLACLFHPTPKEFDTVLDRFPGLGDTFGMLLWDKVLGVDTGAEVKKG